MEFKNKNLKLDHILLFSQNVLSHIWKLFLCASCGKKKKQIQILYW